MTGSITAEMVEDLQYELNGEMTGGSFWEEAVEDLQYELNGEMTGGSFWEEAVEDLQYELNGTEFNLEIRPSRRPQGLKLIRSKQHLVTNVKEMKEDTKKVREKQTSLSVRREFEAGSVTSADKVSIRTSENIATAGDTHKELPLAIAQTDDIDVSGETLQDLSENIGKYWRDVGRKLKLTDGQLDILDLDHSSNHQEKVYQMLLVWKRGTPATYDVLADALKSAGRADLVSQHELKCRQTPFKQERRNQRK